ncbi:GNAT family N-acetyltransferase [Kitasatospora cineracea]|uniref:Ribosomal protein S18 acetylase RimI-like enzyme n=1 Tax=Kitasatospora cineracea TaxID=88074 RepID=A0A3N4RV39_9ACTN|nr:GNAT family N-acetyltransferase [Kitasatospora cineracea]RPE27934.1 ribosomal protein S18 acetylase RimI-like enzyme [Kitasatospora cineracea]
MSETPTIVIRDLAAADEKDWRRLWAGYLDFYESTVPAAVTDSTWRRLLDPHQPLLGRVAERDGTVIGITNSVLHHSTWLTGQVCYLEDLFVDPARRGLGAGRLLLQDLFDLATARGWARVHWLTAHDNPARRLYDTFVPADRFVHYERDLPADDGADLAAANRP